MGKQKNIEYYKCGDIAWIEKGSLDYSSMYGISQGNVAACSDVFWFIPIRALETSKLNADYTVKEKGTIFISDDNAKIVLYDDGNESTPTEERLNEKTSEIVVISKAAVKLYMVSNAYKYGLALYDCGRYDDKISLIKSVNKPLRDITNVCSPKQRSVTIQNVMAKDYNSAEKIIIEKLESTVAALNNLETKATEEKTDDIDDEPAYTGENIESDVEFERQKLAILFQGENPSSYFVYSNVNEGDANTEKKFEIKELGQELIGKSGNVVAVSDISSRSAFGKRFNSVSDEKPVTYRAKFSLVTTALYKLEAFDPILPRLIDAEKYRQIDKFLQNKYRVYKDEIQEYNVDVPITVSVPISESEIIATRPISQSIGMLMKEILTQDKNSQGNSIEIGSRIVHSWYGMSYLAQPYDGKTVPVYSADRRRKKPVGNTPDLGRKIWELPYDSEEWGIIYGRSKQELLDQAESILESMKTSD